MRFCGARNCSGNFWFTVGTGGGGLFSPGEGHCKAAGACLAFLYLLAVSLHFFFRTGVY